MRTELKLGTTLCVCGGTPTAAQLGVARLTSQLARANGQLEITGGTSSEHCSDGAVVEQTAKIASRCCKSNHCSRWGIKTTSRNAVMTCFSALRFGYRVQPCHGGSRRCEWQRWISAERVREASRREEDVGGECRTTAWTLRVMEVLT